MFQQKLQIASNEETPIEEIIEEEEDKQSDGNKKPDAIPAKIEDTIELDDDAMDETEKNEIQQIDNALEGSHEHRIQSRHEIVVDYAKNVTNETEKGDSMVQAEGEEAVLTLLQKTEELITALVAVQEIKEECILCTDIRRRIKENIVEMIKKLTNIDKSKLISEPTLVKISEIARGHAEEEQRAKLFRIVLEEYRKVQEHKVKVLEVEKRDLENAESLQKCIGHLKGLMQIFPKEDSSLNTSKGESLNKSNIRSKSRLNQNNWQKISPLPH